MSLWRRLELLLVAALASAAMAGATVLIVKLLAPSRGTVGDLVYVTPEGGSYHLRGCRTIEGHGVEAITLAEAVAMGRRPCGVCGPPA